MKKRYFVFLLAVIMLALCLMSGCSKELPGPAPSFSATVYNYDSNNIFGLERIAVDGNKIYVYLKKDDSTELYDWSSVISKHTKEEWDEHKPHSKPWYVYCSNNEEKILQTESWYYENEDYCMILSTFDKKINADSWEFFSWGYSAEINNFSQPTIIETIPGGDCESIAIQTYDSSSKKWSNVSDELITYQWTDENGNPLV